MTVIVLYNMFHPCILRLTNPLTQIMIHDLLSLVDYRYLRRVLDRYLYTSTAVPVVYGKWVLDLIYVHERKSNQSSLATLSVGPRQEHNKRGEKYKMQF